MLTSDFIGKNFPPDTSVEYTDMNGKTWRGKVMRMLKNHARVATTEGSVYKVPYAWLRLLSQPACNMTAEEVEAKAQELMAKHKLNDWHFKFDLAPGRGGQCQYSNKAIVLSMSYALKASPAEVINTILHEIAHALVGPGHGHNKVWRSMAQAIGCNGNRCHSVDHAQSKYIGFCGCEDKTWKRDRLTYRVKTGTCRGCGQTIHWELRSIDNDAELNVDDIETIPEVQRQRTAIENLSDEDLMAAINNM